MGRPIIIQEGLEETVKTLQEMELRPSDVSEDYEMMSAFQWALKGIDPSKYDLKLVLVCGKEEMSILRIAIHEPLAVEFVRDHTIAVIAGLLNRKRK